MSKRTPILSMTLGAGALVLVSVLGAWAQLQTSGQQACLNAVNKDGAAVAEAPTRGGGTDLLRRNRPAVATR